ncbi:hypothetical protein F5Y00DRAFT_227262 [Daldinia vernicosa]|uniref:uncharacterized protein n=1 Tax=Daldinia vernicosa TaxID=114800 RepID=UPI0020076BCE|nr:uncharacterized protein F5Y00DRAFT_227262 [Daldinia vernicosa]KAI0852662.1 hypothetical protein F5Y00DRAFT_227262 [Daldinia vernicosa]
MASVDHHYGFEPYSTLEVQSVEASTPQVLEGSNKEVVPHPESPYLQPVSTLNAWDAPKPEANGVDKEAAVTQGQNYGEAKRTICGLSPRIFYVVLAVVVLIIIGAIAGGIAGGLSSKHSDSSSTSIPEPKTEPEPEPGTTENVNVLSTSKLAASNWTDSQGYIHRHVFFQDPYNAIITRQWDSENKTWTTNNVSQLLSSSTTGPIHPIPGTSLACASADNNWGPLYEVHVWFSEASTDPEPTISWANLNDPIGNPNFWTYTPSILRTWNNTQLAVAWQRCLRDDCVGNWVLAYQGPQGFVRIANATNWDNNTEPVVRGSAVSAGASLALAPSLNGTYVHGLTLASQRRPSSMGKTTFIGDWNWKEDDGTILDDVDPLTTRQFAATTMNNWTEALFVALSTDGGVKGARWDGTAYNAIPQINFVDGESTNFSAIAMTTDATFYGISDDQIWEYTVDASDPSTFTLAGKVYP